MNVAEYESIKHNALRNGVWFMAPTGEKTASETKYLGWAIPPFAKVVPFRIFIDDVPVAINVAEDRSEALKHIFLRCGISDPSSLIFSFAFKPVRKFPNQHVARIEFDGAVNSRLLPIYFCDDDIENTPPSANTFRTTHIHDPVIFQFTGRNDFGRLAELHGRHAHSDKLPTVLDWGCGCARISRFMAQKFGVDRVFGVDIDPVNIEWDQKNIDVNQYKLISLYPKLPFQSEFFDFVFGVSVMTHLSRDHQKQWLAEIGRVTAPGGIVILTFHSLVQFFAGVNDIPQFRELMKSGFYDYGRCDDLDEGFDVAAQKEAYRNVFNTEQDIRALCSGAWEIVDFQPGGMMFQDVYVLRKTA